MNDLFVLFSQAVFIPAWCCYLVLVLSGTLVSVLSDFREPTAASLTHVRVGTV